MKTTYYRNEYTEKQWRSLIDEAEKLGCEVVYGRYGDRAEIDSTKIENSLLRRTEKSINDCAARSFWAEHIHGMLQKSTDFTMWKVQPKRYRKGYCATKFKCKEAADHERERLERETSFDWVVIAIDEK